METRLVDMVLFNNIKDSDEEPTDWMDKMFFAIRANIYM